MSVHVHVNLRTNICIFTQIYAHPHIGTAIHLHTRVRLCMRMFMCVRSLAMDTIVMRRVKFYNRGLQLKLITWYT